MIVDALTACVARTSEPMILTMKNRFLCCMRKDFNYLMHWLIALLGHQHQRYCLWIKDFCVKWGRISITCVMSMWRNDMNSKYIFMVPKDNDEALYNLIHVVLIPLKRIVLFVANPTAMQRSQVQNEHRMHSTKFSLLKCFICYKRSNFVHWKIPILTRTPILMWIIVFIPLSTGIWT